MTSSNLVTRICDVGNPPINVLSLYSSSAAPRSFFTLAAASSGRAARKTTKMVTSSLRPELFSLGITGQRRVLFMDERLINVSPVAQGDQKHRNVLLFLFGEYFLVFVTVRQQIFITFLIHF